MHFVRFHISVLYDHIRLVDLSVCSLCRPTYSTFSEMAEESRKKPSAVGSANSALDSWRGNLPPEVIRDGVKFHWMVSERVVQAVKDYDVRDDDVWVTTYPKAGKKCFNESLFNSLYHWLNSLHRPRYFLVYVYLIY